MARQRSKKLSERRSDTQAAIPRRGDDDDSSASEDGNQIFADASEGEDELDRLVLGHGGEFDEQMIVDLSADEEELSEKELEAELGLDEENLDLEEVDDAALFFLDDKGDPGTLNSVIQQPDSIEKDVYDPDAPAWDDSDDDKLQVSLAGHSRLRKLRYTEADDLVSGREYRRRLREQFQRLNPPPAWAQSSGRPTKRRRRSSLSSDSSLASDSMDVNEEKMSAQPLARLLQDASLLSSVSSVKRTTLRPEIIDIQRTRDIPKAQPSTVESLSFHPIYPVLLSSGPSSTLYMHQIDSTAVPEPHPLLTSVHVKSTAISTSAFLGPEGSKIFFSGRRRYFHTWDLASGTIQKVTRIYGHKEDQRSMERFKLSPDGRYMGLVGTGRKGGGTINILDATTSQWIASARIEGRGGIADFAWWRNSEGMTMAGKGGEVGEWSMKTRTFQAIWNDEGTIGGTILALGGKTASTDLGGDRWVAIGSSSGIVNIYDRRPWSEKGVSIPVRPEPTRRLEQLITPTSCLVFSADGQVLAMASRWKADALRLVHLPSCTVYRNWPTGQTPLGRVSAVAFSSNTDMLAVGNEAGKIRLWEIRR